MAPSAKSFSDMTKSKLSELYETYESIETCNPSIQVSAANNRRVSFVEIRQAIIDSMEYCREQTKHIDVEQSISGLDADNVSKLLINLPRNKDDYCTVNAIKIKSFSGVHFTPAQLVQPAKKTAAPKMVPPCFRMEVPKCQPNTVQCLNTGYIFDITQRKIKHDVVGTQIVADPKCTLPQPSVVIIPQIRSKNPGFIPSIQARDAADTGPLTVTVYNRTGEAGTLAVYLYAYTVVLPAGLLVYVDNESAESNVLKPKDLKPGRHVYNLSSKSLFSEAIIDPKDNKMLTVRCFDGTKAGHDAVLDKKIQFNNLKTFFSSRKREWCNPDLFTMAGVFLPGSQSALPKVAAASKFNLNTHCCVFVENRITMYAVAGELNNSHLTMNGSLFNMPQYKELKKALTTSVRDINVLRMGAHRCRTKFDKKYEKEALMRIFDYHHSIAPNDKALDKYYANRDDEEALFKDSKIDIKSSLSANVFRRLKMLYRAFIGPLENDAEYAVVDDDADVEDSVDETPNGNSVITNATVLVNAAVSDNVEQVEKVNDDDVNDSTAVQGASLKRKLEDGAEDSSVCKKLM